MNVELPFPAIVSHVVRTLLTGMLFYPDNKMFVIYEQLCGLDLHLSTKITVKSEVFQFHSASFHKSIKILEIKEPFCRRKKRLLMQRTVVH